MINGIESGCKSTNEALGTAPSSANKCSEREREFDALVVDHLGHSDKDKKTQSEEEVVDEMNKKHAAVTVDQFYILTERENSVFGGTDFSLESKQSFKNAYENKLVTTSDNKTKSKAEIWLKSPKRKEFKGIVFNPRSLGNVNGYYNLWHGFGRAEKRGDCSRYWAHVKDNICGKNQEFYMYVRKWLAKVFQQPDEVHTSLVLVGSQGVGKNSFVDPLGILLGTHYVLLSSISELVSNFNYHLKNAVLIHANEALWGGNRKEIGTLKAMITENTCLIEGKGKDRIMVKNYKHVILSSNEDWPVHLDADDRRFFVLKVSDDHKEDMPYFAAIKKQLENGGYEALLYDLLHEDIQDFNPRKFPHSRDAFDIKMLSARPEDKYIYNALKNECFDIGNATPNEVWGESVSKESVFQDLQTWCVKNGMKYPEADLFSKRLRKIIPSVGDTRPTVSGKRVNKYVLPPLSKAREEFEKFYKADCSIWYV